MIRRTSTNLDFQTECIHVNGKFKELELEFHGIATSQHCNMNSLHVGMPALSIVIYHGRKYKLKIRQI